MSWQENFTEKRISNAIIDMEIRSLGLSVRRWEDYQKDYCRESPNEIRRWNAICEKLARTRNINTRRFLWAELYSTDYYKEVGVYLEKLHNGLNLLKFAKRDGAGKVNRN